MSGTKTIGSIEDEAINQARTLPELIRNLSRVSPDLAQQLVGKSLLASKSVWGNAIAMVVAWAVTKWGLGWDAQTSAEVTGAVVMAATIALRYVTRQPISGILSAFVLIALLGGCVANKSPTVTSVYGAAIALTAADQVALQYVTLPLCGPAHPAPACSQPAITARIKASAQAAHDAVKAAEKSGDNASLAAANAAVAALVAITPTVPTK